MAPYEYSALQTERSTRLLKVFLGGEDAQLALELTEVNLDDKPVYDAISYTWGEDQFLQPIRINGRPCLIRRNIHTFLLELRRRGCTTRLWVDAISIRQDDATEKGHQVHMIGDIFSRARKVLVWVGRHASHSEILFRDGPGFQPRKQRSGQEVADPDLAWIQFTERPYWTRLWIVQELCLAREVIIHCGHSSASWEQLLRYGSASRRVERQNMRDGDITRDQLTTGQKSRHTVLAEEQDSRSRFPVITKLDYFRRMHQKSRLGRYFIELAYGRVLQRQAHDLGFLVSATRSQQCSDPRDRIFALLSLADPKMQRLLPDYTLASAELLIIVCLFRTTELSQNWMTRLQRVEDETREILMFTICVTDRLLDSVQSRREALRLAASMHAKTTKSSQETRTSRFLLAAIRTARWFDQVSDEWPSDVDFAIRDLKASSEMFSQAAFPHSDPPFT